MNENELLLSLYTSYQNYRACIEDLRKKKFKARMPNFPSEISERLPFILLKRQGYTLDLSNKLTGDLNVYIDGILRKIEVKCFSSKGPISFGPTERWYEIYFIDAIKHPAVIIYKCSLSNTEWTNIKVSKNQTFRDQIQQKRRPRITFDSLKSQIPLSVVYKGDLVELLQGSRNQNVIRMADFFAGVGGIRLGFHQASRRFQCVYTNEIDKNAVNTYQTNFSGEVDQRSIENVKSDDIPDFDLMLAGFPCQSFSQAGNRKGFDDSRGILFFELVRILRDKRPKAFLFENVKNLKSHDNGKTFLRIRQEIIQLGYTFKVKILGSQTHGNIPQNRERVFLVGFLDKKITLDFHFPKQIKRTRSISSCLEKNIPEKYYYTPNSIIYPKLVESVIESVSNETVYQYRRYYVRKNTSKVCPTLTANMGSGGHNVPIILDCEAIRCPATLDCEKTFPNRIRKLTPRECFNLQSFPAYFSLPHIADSHLYKQAGNTVTVNVIRRIALNISKVI